jgi:hypothetical protein
MLVTLCLSLLVKTAPQALAAYREQVDLEDLEEMEIVVRGLAPVVTVRVLRTLVLAAAAVAPPHSLMAQRQPLSQQVVLAEETTHPETVAQAVLLTPHTEETHCTAVRGESVRPLSRQVERAGAVQLLQETHTRKEVQVAMVVAAAAAVLLAAGVAS